VVSEGRPRAGAQGGKSNCIVQRKGKPKGSSEIGAKSPEEAKVIPSEKRKKWTGIVGPIPAPQSHESWGGPDNLEKFESKSKATDGSLFHLEDERSHPRQHLKKDP